MGTAVAPSLFAASRRFTMEGTTVGVGDVVDVSGVVPSRVLQMEQWGYGVRVGGAGQPPMSTVVHAVVSAPVSADGPPHVEGVVVAPPSDDGALINVGEPLAPVGMFKCAAHPAAGPFTSRKGLAQHRRLKH